jgi:uncharacterized protein YcbK (DUF882 family)
MVYHPTQEQVKYFKFSEFDSPDAPGSGARMDTNFLKMLDEARELSGGVPFHINSGFRTPKHNKRINGSKNSSHMRGLAADIRCTNSRDRFRIVAALIAAGFSRVGIHDQFIHCDCDSVKTPGVVWLYA